MDDVRSMDSVGEAPTRRAVLLGGAALAGAVAAPAVLRAQPASVLRIGYWPIAAALPFFVAVGEGYFAEAGVTVEVQNYATAQQIVEAILAGRCDGSANGTASANLALGELASPGLVKLICSNPTNAEFVLDQVLVPADSDAASIADLAGLTLAGGPGIQNMTLARMVFERGGAAGANVVELPFPQHVGSIVAGQIEGAYSLEPQGTIGRLNGATRVLEAGVVAKYILGDPMAPWHGGSASLSAAVVRDDPGLARDYVAAYRRGVAFVREQPDAARKYFLEYTPLTGEVANQVPISGYAMYDELDQASIAYFQKFFDVFSDAGIFSAPVPVEPLLYAG